MGKLIVLVVEDEFLIAEDLKFELEQLGHGVIGPAPNCSAALDLLRDGKPDLALVDTQLGAETCEEILDQCREMGVPVIISTAHSKLVVPDYCADLPQINKPFQRPEIARALADLRMAG